MQDQSDTFDHYYEDVPLEDDYFMEGPEEIIQKREGAQLEGDIRLMAEMAFRKARKKMESDVLIVGAGITGMQAALDIADKGYRVILLDKTATIGGNMVKLDKTFPTNDCSICTAAPKMVEVARQPNIELLTYSELTGLEGEAGDFTARIYKKSQYVDPNKCTGCNDCVPVCPVEVTNVFEERLTKRKAIYIEFPQAVPVVYTIDYDACIGCGACERVCEPEAISFLTKSEDIEIKVGSIIVATGFELFEPLEMRKEYGYGKYPNVITAMQFERLLSSYGPTEGKIRKPSDNLPAHSIAWIQCVGSRSKQEGFPYCSRVCCMYATKEASIAKEMDPDTDITIFYMDLRAYGKDFQQYYNKAEKMGVKYVRSRPASVYENEDRTITIRYLDTHTREVREQVVELLVLSTAIMPSRNNPRLAQALGIEADEHGFFQAADILSDPIESTRKGVYLAGCIQGPKDIPDSVAMGSAAAARAMEAIINRDQVVPVPNPTEREVRGEKPKIGVFVCHCGKNIHGYLDTVEVAEYARTLPNVTYATDVMFACAEDSIKDITRKIKEEGFNRVIVAACSPITHGPLFQDTLVEAGLNKYLFEFANIRQHCSWVHSHDRETATKKAKDLIRMSVSKSNLLEPLTEEEVSVTPSVLIIGGGLSGMKSALALADMDIESYILEQETQLGGTLRKLHTLFPSDVKASVILDPIIKEVHEAQRITVFTGSSMESLKGFVGNFEATISTPEGPKELKFGTAIISTGFQEIDLTGRYGYGDSDRIMTQTELEGKLRDGNLKAPRRVVMINCAGAMEEERPWCCRIGCGVSIKNAKLLKERYPNSDIHILYRDIRVFGTREEEYFAQVIEDQEVKIIRYSLEDQPRVTTDRDGNLTVTVNDEIYKNTHELPADLVVLTAQTEGHPSTTKLMELLKVPAGPGGFYIEAHAKIRPLDFSTDGLYFGGAAHFPKNLADTIAQAEGAASRAAIPILKGRLVLDGITAAVAPEMCCACGLCVAACPYQAISMEDGDLAAKVNPALCKGCGVCAATCRSGAIQQGGFTDNQLLSMIKGALHEVV